MRFSAALPIIAGAASGVGAEEYAVFLRAFQSAPTAAQAALFRSVERARDACAVDVSANCVPRDPFEEFLSSLSSSSSSSILRSDPFLRMALTPPSVSESPSLLDQVFNGGDQAVESLPSQVMVVEGDDDMTGLFRVLDGMMESAVRIALEPPPEMLQSVIFFEEDAAAEKNGEVEEEHEEAPRDPAGVAVKALDAMMDGLLDHVSSVSSSASASSDIEEDEPTLVDNEDAAAADRDEAPHDESETPRQDEAHRSDDKDNEAARSEPDAPLTLTKSVVEAEVSGPESHSPFHPTWDPVLLSRKIAEHGREVLAEEEERRAGAGRNGDLRRRLTVDHENDESSIRMVLAQRMTQVEPFGHISVRPFPIAPAVQTVIEFDKMPPRLGFGCPADRCLWSLRVEEDGAVLSGGCREALKAVEESAQEERREAEVELLAPVQRMVEETGVNAGEEWDIVYYSRTVEFVQTHPSAFWLLWALVATSLLGCIFLSGCEDEDENENECEDGYGDASDYVLVQDDVKDSAVVGEGSRPKGETAAFVGVPLRVV